MLVIKKFPEPVLRKVSAPITRFDSSLEKLVKRLIKIMKAQPGGVGIAAPQIGILKKVAVVDVSPKVASTGLLVLINPEIVKLDREIVLREGCMSLPDYTANVKRYDVVTIKGRDLLGGHIIHQATGLEARCIQHEVDHLNGILFVDRVASLHSDVFRRKKYL